MTDEIDQAVAFYHKIGGLLDMANDVGVIYATKLTSLLADLEQDLEDLVWQDFFISRLEVCDSSNQKVKI